MRTEGLEVRDLDRSPIASDATLAMASMPFDMHSASVAGTQPWTRLTLRFIAGLQNRFFDQFESKAPAYKDFEASGDLLQHRDVVFVGRPEANSALAAWAEKLGLEYRGGALKIDGEWHASEREALLLAARNPLDASHMVLVITGNDALRTVKATRAEAPSEYVLYSEGAPPAAGFIGMGTASAQAAGGRRRQ